MILVDTGPLVGLFDAHDQHHKRCRRVLETFDEKLITTVPVLTEALHLLRPGSPGPPRLMGYIRQGGLTVVPLDAELLRRCFELMLQYADTPMDFADASIVCAAEHTRTEKVFTTGPECTSPSYRIAARLPPGPLQDRRRSVRRPRKPGPRA